tara:strand:- start:42 stop:791 length:750 start_codon:yes stop_codon:yes gene_type:complete
LKDTPLLDASLTLVGVGPGDPSLLTLAAVEAIKAATVVSFPISSPGEQSIAAKIAANWITEDKRQLPLIFPMVSKIAKRKEAWRNAGEQLASAMSNGEKIVFLSQGDVSLFSTSSYVLLELQLHYPDFQLKLIPGVNSFAAAAANAHWPLCLQQEQLLIMPTPDKPEILENVLNEASQLGRVVVLLKVGKRWNWVRILLKKMDLLENSLFAEKVGFTDEIVLPSNQVALTDAKYFSLLVIRQSMPNVMP